MPYSFEKPISDKDKQLVLDLVAFCILMENNDGIRGKSPAYIIEKFKMAMQGNRGMLDSRNQLKYIEYTQSWYNGDEKC